MHKYDSKVYESYALYLRLTSVSAQSCCIFEPVEKFILIV